MPSVAPNTSCPRKAVGDHVVQPPARVSRSLATTFRAPAMSSAQAMSAVVSASTPGVFVTTIPRLAASAGFTLS